MLEGPRPLLSADVPNCRLCCQQILQLLRSYCWLLGGALSGLLALADFIWGTFEPFVLVELHLGTIYLLHLLCLGHLVQANLLCQ